MIHFSEPTFPPLLTGHAVPANTSSYVNAVCGAWDGRLGAGDVVWCRDDGAIDWAFVLEPDVTLARAVQMGPLVMVAIGDCLGALTPPQVGVTFRWPGEIYLNAGQIGDVKISASTRDPDVVPDWLVVGARLALRNDDRQGEPGDAPELTAIAEEGGESLTSVQVLESVTRHFMTWLNIWNEEGFRKVHEAWTFRAAEEDEPYELRLHGETIRGTFAGLDEDGGLLYRNEDGQIAGASLLSNVDLPDQYTASP